MKKRVHPRLIYAYSQEGRPIAYKVYAPRDVWIAYDRTNDVVYLYNNCALFERI